MTRLRELPSIDLLRTFDMTARHLSFAKAADELALTPSAVSRQIKNLEENLGLPLYIRGVRSLELTDVGKRLHADVDVLLTGLQTTITQLKSREDSPQVGLSTTVSFASLWLLPRLASFSDNHPHINLRVKASSDVLDIKRKEFDFAIRYASPHNLPPQAQVLLTEGVRAVCSPKLVQAQGIEAPQDLRSCTLLHMDDLCGDMTWYQWANWFQVQGSGELGGMRKLRFNQYDQLIQAARDGHGVALGRLPLIQGFLDEGSLIAPFQEPLIPSGFYYLVQKHNAHSSRNRTIFLNWLLEQVDGVAPPS